MPMPLKKGPLLICRKSGRIVGFTSQSRLLRWLLPLVGFVALVWYLVRVVPKPSRALYPCQRAAAPFAGGFVVWLVGAVGSAIAWRRGRELARRSQWRRAWLAFAVAAVGAIAVVVNLPNPPVRAAVDTAPHGPLGVARGIHPGRVVWVHAPDAVHWDGYESPEPWWGPTHTDLATVDEMMASAVRGVAGASTDEIAWNALFHDFNRKKGRGERGYQAGEKITIKINLTACNARWEAVNPATYEKKILNTIDNSPQMILALLRQLVQKAGVNPADISVGDPTALFPNYMWNILHQEFPDVHYFDNLGGAGRTRTEFSGVPMGWSTPAADGKLQDYLPVQFAEADYIINFALLKGHSPGITVCAKNDYGSLLRTPEGYLRDAGMLDYYNLHLSLPNAGWSPGMGKYRALVDLMGHRQLGGKTLLYLIDGLFGGLWGGSAHPYKWRSAPFGTGLTPNWPASLLASQDPVAIDSVAYDLLLNEWPDVVTGGTGAPGSLEGGAEDYLHEAALADNPPSGTFYDPEKSGSRLQSLGVHEHWNNPADKLYSRNLGSATGIKLVRVMLTPNQSYTVDGQSLVCAGSADNVYTSLAPPGASHSWSISGNGTLVGAIDGSSVTVAAGTSGTFTLIDSVMLNGYDSVGSMVVAIDPAPSCGQTPNQRPVVTLTAPANGAAFIAPATIEVTATAADSDGTVSKVEFYNGAKLLQTATAEPYRWTLTGVGPGTYVLTAKVYDNLGATAVSTATVAVVDPHPNVALAANGGVASASSTYNAITYPVAAVNDGDRSGATWGSGGGWNDATNNAYPDYVQITFNGLKTIDEVDVITLQDALTGSVTPTPAMTFTRYGVTAFDVQYWDGMGWVTVPGGNITGNNLVWRKIALTSPITTDRIRVQVNSALAGYSRIVEIEAYSPAAGSVTPMTPAITWGPLAAITYGTALSASQLNATTGVAGTYSYTPPANTVLSAGTQTLSVTFTPTDTATYTTATGTVSITVNPAGQTIGAITFTPATLAVGGATTVAATGGASGNPVTFTSTTPTVCTVSGSTVTGVAAGTCTVAANQAGDANYSAATQVTTGITVGVGTQTTLVLQVSPSTLTYGSTSALSSTGGNGTGAVSYNAGTSTGCAVSGSTLSVTTATGTCSVTATKAADSNYASATSAPVTVTLAKATQSIGAITFTPATLAVGGATTVAASGGTSGNPVTFTSLTTGVCTVSGSTVTGVAAGTCTVAANQAGTANYSAATQVSQNFTVSSGTVTRTNVALANSGGVATASSVYSANYPVAAVNNGDRIGAKWATGGGWNDATNNVYSDYVQIAFNGQKTLDEFDVFTVQDALTGAVTPTPTMTFTKYGLTSFDVQYCPPGTTCTVSGTTGWVPVPGGSVTGNNKVWTTITLATPVTTDRIRVKVNGSLAGYSRVVEIEAYGQ